jgi:LexA-binding, inner membrane-associated putative hydrolase
MANFATHLAVGIIGSGALATLTQASGMVAQTDIVTLACAGAIGAILPDIDLGSSRPSQLLFTGLGIVIAFAVMFNLPATYSLAEMWVAWVGTFLGIRFIGHNVFHHISHHRGIFHSLIGGLFFACVTAIFYVRGLGHGPGLAWLAASFVLIGFLSHLILDEIYSVDVFNTKIKASFGTAMKFADFQHPGASLAMAAALALAFFFAPPLQDFTNVVLTKPLWVSFQGKLLPHDHNWFGVTASLHDAVVNLMGSTSAKP